MSRFENGFCKEQIEYFLETDQFQFSDLWDIIQDAVKPTSVGEYEITSWTEANTFEKFGLGFYIENFYANTPSVFTIRLFPFGKHSKDDIEKLNEIIKLIDNHIRAV